MGFQAPNFTKVPNELIDKMLPGLSAVEIKVLLVIIRKIDGWHKRIDQISLAQLMEFTGSSRPNITKAIKKLQKLDLIIKHTIGEKGDQKTLYELKVDYGDKDQCRNNIPPSTETVPPPSVETTLPPQCRNNTTPSVETTPTKETITKENIEISKDISLVRGKPQTKEVSPEIENLEKKFLEEIKKVKPDFVGKSSKNWHLNCQKLLKVRTEEKILKILRWCLQDPFWKGNVLSPNGLLNNLDQIETKMAQNPSEGDVKEIFERHAIQAKKYDEKKWRGERVMALNSSVEFLSGISLRDTVSYSVSEKEWFERTGWTLND